MNQSQCARKAGQALALLLLGACSAAAPATPVGWRTDYVRARKEAAEKARPLLLSVGSPGCVWCRRMHETTFRDRAVADALNQQFIALKVDAGQDPDLVRALPVQGFPTTIFAAPDGTIVHTVDGYVDAPALQRHMRHALARVHARRQPASR